MVNQHRAPRRILAMVASAIGLLTLTSPPAAVADDQATTPMPGVFRRCDHSANTYYSSRGDGRAVAFLGTGRHGDVVADVQLATALPNTRYTVRLIQMPRPTLTCTPSDPGVAAAALDTDAAGAATVTLRAPMLPGTTGAWVYIDRPSEFSQKPAEFYTSDFVAAV